MSFLIQDWVVAFSLILARVTAFVVTFPFLGSRAVPLIVRNALILTLSLFWMDQWQTLPAEELRRIGGHWFLYGLMIGKEVIIGAILGYGFSLVTVPFRVAGEYIGQEMGLTIARITDPTRGQGGTAVGQIFESVGIVLFFQLNFHQVFLTAFHASFIRRPVGGAMEPVSPDKYIRAVAWAQESGLAMIAPVGCWLFLTMVILALMTRAAPQLNIMSVGFILRLITGQLAVFLLLPDIGPAMTKLMHEFGQMIYAF